MVVEMNGHLKFYKFEPGEHCKVHRDRYSVSRITPLWIHQYECEIVCYNKSGTVTVMVKGYEDERHYVDAKDLVPMSHDFSKLA